MKLKKSALATLVFLLLLLLVYYLQVRYTNVNVVLYSAVLGAVVAAAIAGGMLVWLRYFEGFNAFEKMQMIVIWLLVGYAFAISVPTVIDRSLSFYILEKLQQRGGGIRQDSFSDVFTKEYMVEHRLVDVRLTEQLESGTIVIRNGCVLLTERGRELASFSRQFRKYLLPRHRLLMGAYSDDLTDPFRHSRTDVAYTCK